MTTGNEDGGKHVSAQVLYALQHIGLDDPAAVRRLLERRGRPGDLLPRPRAAAVPENAWTTRNTVFMTWNILHLARMLKDAGGIPAYGNATRRLGPLGARRIPIPSTAAEPRGGGCSARSARGTIAAP